MRSLAFKWKDMIKSVCMNGEWCWRTERGQEPEEGGIKKRSWHEQVEESPTKGFGAGAQADRLRFDLILKHVVRHRIQRAV